MFKCTSNSSSSLLLLLFLLVFAANANAFRYFGSYQKPNQIHVAFTGKQGEAAVMWIAPSADKKYHVQYSYESKNYTMSVAGVSKKYSSNPGYSANVFEAILTDLRPHATVFYRVGNDLDTNSWSDEFSFVTYPGDSAPVYPYRFLSYGDMDTGYDAQQTITRLEEQLKEDKLIKFIIHQGDLPYAWSEDKWDTWGNMIEDVAANKAYMVCPGNHENSFNFTSYKSRFTNSTGVNSGTNSNLFYSWNYQNIHFVALSSEHAYTPGSEQYNWLENDLKRVDRSKTPFVISYSHRPMYCSNQNHGSELGFRVAIEPLLSKYNVNVAIFGHVHAYERSCPLKNGECVQGTEIGKNEYNGEGTIHVIAGTAGFELNPNWDNPQPEWSKYRETNHGFMKITVPDRNTISFQFLRNHDVSVAETFTIKLQTKQVTEEEPIAGGLPNELTGAQVVEKIEEVPQEKTEVKAEAPAQVEENATAATLAATKPEEKQAEQVAKPAEEQNKTEAEKKPENEKPFAA